MATTKVHLRRVWSAPGKGPIYAVDDHTIPGGKATSYRIERIKIEGERAYYQLCELHGEGQTRRSWVTNRNTLREIRAYLNGIRD